MGTIGTMDDLSLEPLATDGGPAPSGWSCSVALGDSFTEGLEDLAPEGGYRGWADRLAETLVAGAPGGDLRYANLAVRGKLLPEIVAEQVPAALALQPDLVSLVGGGNDVLRPGSDPDRLADLLEDAVHTVRESGADVLMATGVDPVNSPIISLTRSKVAVYNNHIWSIARRQGAHVVDLWGMRELQDRRMWAADRIHLTAEGHQRVAWQAAEVLGAASGHDWATPLPPGPELQRLLAVREDAQWVREYVGPWVGRRLRRRSSGDAVTAKRPQAGPVLPPTP